MTDAKPRRGRIRHRTVRLNRNELVGRMTRRSAEVRVQLIERLAAYAAVTAVFEEQNRTLARLRNRRVQLGDVR